MHLQDYVQNNSAFIYTEPLDNSTRLKPQLSATEERKILPILVTSDDNERRSPDGA